MKNATCLCKALALQRLLARNGHHSELRIGVDKVDGQFTAHAWLVHNGASAERWYRDGELQVARRVGDPARARLV